MKHLIRSWKFWAVIASFVVEIVAIVLYFAVPALKEIARCVVYGIIVAAAIAGYLWLKKVGALDD